MGVVHEEPITRKYYAYGSGGAGICNVLALLITIVLPFVIALLTGNFWTMEGFTWEQPDVHFNQKAILLLEGKQISDSAWVSRMWTSNNYVNNMIPSSRLIFPQFKMNTVDSNSDGFVDNFLVKVSAPLDDIEVHRASILLFFDYKFKRIFMEGLAYIDYHSATAGASMHTNGHLVMKQGSPLYQFDSRTHPANFSLDQITSIDQLHIPSIFNGYFAQEDVVKLEPYDTVWMTGKTKAFKIDVNIKIPSQRVFHTPHVFQVIKFAWVQYFCIMMAVGFIAFKLKAILIVNGVISSRLVWDDPVHKLR